MSGGSQVFRSEGAHLPADAVHHDVSAVFSPDGDVLCHDKWSISVLLAKGAHVHLFFMHANGRAK
jgi:hypothetical protein